MGILDSLENLGQDTVNGFTSLGGLLGLGGQKPDLGLLQSPGVVSQNLPPLGQPQPAPPSPPPEQQGFVSTLLANPALADALGRMSTNFAEASKQGYNTAAGLGYGLSGLQQGVDDYKTRQAALAKTGADANLANAQAGLATAQGQVAKLKQGLPEQGDSVEAGAVNRQYAYYVSQGMAPHDAFVKAYNEAGLKPQVTPGGAVITPNPLPASGAPYQGGGSPAPVAAAAAVPGSAAGPQSGPAAPAMGSPNVQAQGVPQLNGIQQANASNKYGETAAGNQASQINDQLTSGQKDYADAQQILGPLQKARQLSNLAFSPTGGPIDLKMATNNFLHQNPDKVAATAGFEAQMNTALGPILRMTDTGPNGQFRMLDKSLTQGMKTIGDVNQQPETRNSLLDPNIARMQAISDLANYKVQMAQKGVLVTPDMTKAFYAAHNTDPTTLLPVGKDATSYLPSAQSQSATPSLQSAIAAEMKRRGLN